MTAAGTPATQRKAWLLLAAHQRQLEGRSLRELFAADPARGEQLAQDAVGIYLDYSKQRITDETKRLLLSLAIAMLLVPVSSLAAGGARRTATWPHAA